MNVTVNGRFLARRVTGVERYGQEILRCLGDRLRVVRSRHRLQGVRGHFWEQIILPGKIRSDEILWSPANTGPLSVSNQVLTIHDLSPLEHPEWFKPAFVLWYRLLWPALARRVKRILVHSENVRQKVMQRFCLSEDRVVAISAGVDLQKFRPMTPDARKYILFVGSLEPRKNLSGLLQAWDETKSRHPTISLMIAGAGGDVFQSIGSPSKKAQVKFLGYVPESDLPTLYARALLFIMPSFDEGFGLPVLEAMACGTPVMAANVGALPEVVGEAGLLFNPADSHEMAKSIDSGLTDPHIRQCLSEKGLERAQRFSWEKTAEATWKVLQECQ